MIFILLPYSEELTLRIEELCNLGFLDEVKEKGRLLSIPVLADGDGSRVLHHAELTMPDMKKYIDSVNSRSSRFLELVSTILYFDYEAEEKKEKVFTIKANRNIQMKNMMRRFTT